MVVVKMKLGIFLVSCLVFAFVAFIFGDLQNAVNNMTYTGTLKPLIQVFPLMLVVLTAAFPIFLLIKEAKD